MRRHTPHKLDAYTELYPASSVMLIGSGLIVGTMGGLPFGAALVLTGVAVGLAGPVARAVHDRKVANQRRPGLKTSFVRRGL